MPGLRELHELAEQALKAPTDDIREGVEKRQAETAALRKKLEKSSKGIGPLTAGTTGGLDFERMIVEHRQALKASSAEMPQLKQPSEPATSGQSEVVLRAAARDVQQRSDWPGMPVRMDTSEMQSFEARGDYGQVISPPQRGRCPDRKTISSDSPRSSSQEDQRARRALALKDGDNRVIKSRSTTALRTARSPPPHEDPGLIAAKVNSDRAEILRKRQLVAKEPRSRKKVRLESSSPRRGLSSPSRSSDALETLPSSPPCADGQSVALPAKLGPLVKITPHSYFDNAGNLHLRSTRGNELCVLSPASVRKPTPAKAGSQSIVKEQAAPSSPRVPRPNDFTSRKENIEGSEGNPTPSPVWVPVPANEGSQSFVKEKEVLSSPRIPQRHNFTSPTENIDDNEGIPMPTPVRAPVPAKEGSQSIFKETALLFSPCVPYRENLIISMKKDQGTEQCLRLGREGDKLERLGQSSAVVFIDGAKARLRDKILASSPEKYLRLEVWHWLVTNFNDGKRGYEREISDTARYYKGNIERDRNGQLVFVPREPGATTLKTQPGKIKAVRI